MTIHTRCDFGRTPLYRPDCDYIPSIPDNPPVIDSPIDAEVHFTEDSTARHVSIYTNFNEKEQELEVVVGYNSIKADMLDAALKNSAERHVAVKTLTVTGATANMRSLGHRTWLEKSGFKRAPDRSRSTWSFSLDLEQAAANRRKRPAVAEANRRRAKEKQTPEVEMQIDMFVSTLRGLEVARDRYIRDGLTVPHSLEVEIERARETLSISEDLERERETLKQNSEWLALEAEIKKLRGGI